MDSSKGLALFPPYQWNRTMLPWTPSASSLSRCRLVTDYGLTQFHEPGLSVVQLHDVDGFVDPLDVTWNIADRAILAIQGGRETMAPTELNPKSRDCTPSSLPLEKLVHFLQADVEDK